jgi:hypothetical protein
MVRVHGKVKHDQEEARRVRRGLGSHNPFLGHAPNVLKTSDWAPSLKGSRTSQQ